MKIFKLLSPAKINLYLRVLRKRADGFHDIDSLFERVSLCDELVFSPHPSRIVVRSSLKSLPTGPRNSVYRAAKLLKKRFRVKKGARIFIQKNIPVAAGLGGGSSNAATALLGLNRLWRLGLSRRELLALAAKIGSDAPFFVLETPFAVARGRGEILKPVSPPRRKMWHCLVKPPFGISTQAAYEALSPSSLTPQMTDVKIILRSIHKGRSGELRKLLFNSLESVLNKRLRTIQKIKERLAAAGAFTCLMSGSGSAVFGVFSSKNRAEKAARALRRQKGWRVFVVSTY